MSNPRPSSVEPPAVVTPGESCLQAAIARMPKSLGKDFADQFCEIREQLLSKETPEKILSDLKPREPESARLFIQLVDSLVRNQDGWPDWESWAGPYARRLARDSYLASAKSASGLLLVVIMIMFSMAAWGRYHPLGETEKTIFKALSLPASALFIWTVASTFRWVLRLKAPCPPFPHQVQPRGIACKSCGQPYTESFRNMSRFLGRERAVCKHCDLFDPLIVVASDGGIAIEHPPLLITISRTPTREFELMIGAGSIASPDPTPLCKRVSTGDEAMNLVCEILEPKSRERFATRLSG